MKTIRVKHLIVIAVIAVAVTAAIMVLSPKKSPEEIANQYTIVILESRYTMPHEEIIKGQDPLSVYQKSFGACFTDAGLAQFVQETFRDRPSGNLGAGSDWGTKVSAIQVSNTGRGELEFSFDLFYGKGREDAYDSLHLSGTATYNQRGKIETFMLNAHSQDALDALALWIAAQPLT